MTSFYRMAVPTQWATPPEQFSFSSLQAIETCPRKWQLLHSAWGEYGFFPQRPHPMALEGSIVHEGIERLVRALGKRGLPSIASPTFRQTVAEIDFWGHFAKATNEWNARLARHPRAGPFFVLRTPPRELANRAIRLFREQYRPRDTAPHATEPSIAHSTTVDPWTLLEQRGAISEIEVEHPHLPFRGFIDLVQIVAGEVQVIDFKTGKRKHEHERQIHVYGLLWWRRTGVRPSRLVVQYLDEQQEWRVDEERLLAVEQQLAESIGAAKNLLADTPAEARPGKGCGYCPARARCSTGWRAYQANLGQPRTGTTDIEVTVIAEPSANGFLANAGGRKVHVVFDTRINRQLPSLAPGDTVRLLDVVVRNEGATYEIRSWTEVYAVD